MRCAGKSPTWPQPPKTTHVAGDIRPAMPGASNAASPRTSGAPVRCAL
jgi:hypothetical protein